LTPPWRSTPKWRRRYRQPKFLFARILIFALGIRHIVNLGLHGQEKALPDETASVNRLGMTYIHIPVDFQNPTDQDFDQFCAVMEQLKDDGSPRNPREACGRGDPNCR
jgi:hypothetical protein